ncbi:metal-dependent hydrolase [Siminovitchia terrae]|uniref:Metal-dependent hydrolase n=2 Tax=Siminovitchia terrae TaxID=1914933 RepID=A0ABQ4KSX7_SIMTE|nr:endonuclease/exonuclease/phosphatase family protein [Siminovitchia terrae]GIN95147.1 metal-dependent hydrolase [Siminovitchia terrae]
MKIRVMTFNIHHGKGMDKQANLSRIAEVIDLCNADIIGLNEVDRHFSKRSLYEDQASWLADQLKMDYAFSPSITKQSKSFTNIRQYGNALLSRLPIITRKSHKINSLSGIIEGRSLLDATIQINKRPVQINVTHLSLNPYFHKKQTDFILNHHHMKNSNPIILMGDLNMKQGSSAWRKLSEEFQDVWYKKGKGAGCTYPSLRPRSRLDYIFASRDFKVVNAEIVSKIPKASDHLPVTATLSFKS